MDFEKDVLEASKNHPVVVDFWAEWCGPCKTLGPILEKAVAQSNGSLSLVKVDVDQHMDLAQIFQVQGIPFVLIFKDGQPIDGFQGALPEDQLQQWLSQYITEVEAPEVEEEDPEHQESVQALISQGKTEEAITALKALLETEEDAERKDETKLLLGKLLLGQDPKHSCNVLSDFLEDSKFFDSANKLLMLAQFLAVENNELSEPPNLATYILQAREAFNKGDMENCLDELLEVLYRDKTYQDDMARKAFIGVFEFLGRDHQTVKAYQRRFEMAIF